MEFPTLHLKIKREAALTGKSAVPPKGGGFVWGGGVGGGGGGGGGNHPEVCWLCKSGQSPGNLSGWERRNKTPQKIKIDNGQEKSVPI